MEACSEVVFYDDLGNSIFGNAEHLPRGQSQGITDNPGGLAVSPPPEIMPAAKVE